MTGCGPKVTGRKFLLRGVGVLGRAPARGQTYFRNEEAHTDTPHAPSALPLCIPIQTKLVIVSSTSHS